MTHDPLAGVLPRRFRRRCVPYWVLVLVTSCGSEDGEARRTNQPPDTEIVSPVLSGAPVSYRLSVAWRGSDADGAVTEFEVAVDDTASWSATSRGDSLLEFPSPACCVRDTIRFPDGTFMLDSLAFGSHTLYVRAVDSDGDRDPTPARIAFTSTTLTPETEVIRGPLQGSGIGVVPTTVVVVWRGSDPDGEVASYAYKLDEAAWVTVPADCTRLVLRDLTTAQFPGDEGAFHTFRILATDNAGAMERTVDLGDNERRWESVRELGGTLVITSNVMGSRVGVGDSPEAQICAGERLWFDWRGDASLYGGEIRCYRVSFDHESYSPCVSTTRFPAGAPDFFPSNGHHVLSVLAQDDADQEIPAEFRFEVIPISCHPDPNDRQILFIDDYDEGTGGPGILWPTDPTEDAFWDSVLAGYDVRRFDTDASGEIPDARDIGERSTLVWYVDSESFLKTSNDPSNFRNPIGPYLNAGGNLILCGAVPTLCFAPDNHFELGEIDQPGCPHDPRTTYGGGGHCLDWYPAPCDTTPFHLAYDFLQLRQSCSEPAVHVSRLESTGLPVTPGGLPAPGLRLDLRKRGVLANGDSILALGLEECEEYVLREGGGLDTASVVPLWTAVDANGLERRVCGFYLPRDEETGRGHVVVLGFSPFYFDTLEMRALFRSFLYLFGERNADDPFVNALRDMGFDR